MKRMLRVSAACAVAVAASVVQADTVLMKDGSTIDGKVIQRSGGMLRVRVNDQEASLPEADVASVEANDKTGKATTSAEDIERLAMERDKELVEKTGLQLRQRLAVDELLQVFFLGDEDSSQQAKRSFMEMAKTANPYRYLELRLPEITPTKLAPMIEVMFALNPAGMRDTLRQCALSPSETARAASLRCLAKLRDRSSLDLMRRGMADEDSDVRIAAVHGIEALGAREATPVLLKAMKGGDMRVQNASRDTLSALWTDPGQPPPNFLKNADWDEFWKTKAAGVPGAWDLAAVEPLVAPGTVYEAD